MAKNGREPDSVARYDAALPRLQEIHGQVATLERRISELQSRTAEPRDDVGDAARALLDGPESENGAAPPEVRAELSEARDRLRVVRRAAELQRGRVEEAKAARDRHLRDAAAPGIEAAAQEVAEAAVTFGDAVDGLHERLDALRAEGVSPTARFPGIRLFPLRSSEPLSRLNTFIDELEDGYGVEVERGARDAAKKALRERQERDAKRAAEAGGTVRAGPDGVFRSEAGGRWIPMSPKKGPREGPEETVQLVRTAAGPDGRAEFFSDGTERHRPNPSEEG